MRTKYIKTGCGVTANIFALGANDSGFESRHPDNLSKAKIGGVQ